MAPRCPIGFDAERLRQQVERTSDGVGRETGSDFHRRVGAEFAIRSLGYPREAVESLPASSTGRFAGVGNPHAIGLIPRGAVVLDHACRAGMDLLLAARAVGPTGRAIGVDITPALRDCTARAALEAGLAGVVEIRAGAFEDLPVEDSSVNYVLSNGVLNLARDKARVFREIERVLKPGGHLHLADVVVERDLSDTVRGNPDRWAACADGAVTEDELASLAGQAGLVDGEVVAHFDCFRDIGVERKPGRSPGLRAVAFYARKPGAAIP